MHYLVQSSQFVIHYVHVLLLDYYLHRYPIYDCHKLYNILLYNLIEHDNMYINFYILYIKTYCLPSLPILCDIPA